MVHSLRNIQASIGNSLKVSMVGTHWQTVVTKAFNAWAYKGNFDAKPTTSSFVSALGGKNDEVHIAVIDEDGLISGTARTQY